MFKMCGIIHHQSVSCCVIVCVLIDTMKLIEINGMKRINERLFIMILFLVYDTADDNDNNHNINKRKIGEVIAEIVLMNDEMGQMKFFVKR